MPAAILLVPAELYLHIFSFLPANHVWRLRRVCKAWRGMLSSKAAEVAACNAHETHDSADSIATDDWERRKALVRAHHQGRPVGLVHKTPFDQDEETPVCPVFIGNFFATTENCYPERVTLFYLDNGSPVRYSADGDIEHLCLTSRLLAYTTSDKLYVVQHDKNIAETSPIQGKLLSIAGDDEIIVMRLEVEGKESLVVRDGKTWPIPSQSSFKYETKVHATLLLGQKCYLLTYIYGSDEEEVETGADCRHLYAEHIKHVMHIIVLDIVTGETSFTTREYKPTVDLYEDTSNYHLQKKLTVHPTGRRDEYHLGIEPAAAWGIEHDLLLDLETLTFKQCFGGETLAVWKGMIYSCREHPEFDYAGLNAWITIDSTDPKHKSYLLTDNDPGMNHLMAARIFVNESFLLFIDPFGWLSVYSFDEGLVNKQLPALDLIDLAEVREDFDEPVWVNRAIGQEESESDSD